MDKLLDNERIDTQDSIFKRLKQENTLTVDKKMPLKAKVMLGPIQKYQLYSKCNDDLTDIDKFPLKLIIHILLVVFTSLQVSLMVTQTGDYSRT